MLAAVMPAVVGIKATGNRALAVELPGIAPGALATGMADVTPASPGEPFVSSGSGVVIDAAKGIIVTNDHVIAGATTIVVTLATGRKFPATLIGTDPATDISLLEVKAPGLAELKFSNSDTAQIGDLVVAIGNPLGLEGTATLGIVSAKMRTDIGYETIEDFLQVDAAINKGSSGGALVDLRGDLVGINTAGVGVPGAQGISFAIPSRIVEGVTDILRRDGRVHRGILGMRTEDLTPEIAATRGLAIEVGALVANVVANSPAAVANVAAGDVIIEIDGRPITKHKDYLASLALGIVGQHANVTLYRAGKTFRERLMFAEVERDRMRIAVDAARPVFTGLVLGALEPGFPLFGEVQGAYVVAVVDDSPLQRAGLRVGDVIITFDDIKIRTLTQAIQAVELLPATKRLQIIRDGKPYWVRLSPA